VNAMTSKKAKEKMTRKELIEDLLRRTKEAQKDPEFRKYMQEFYKYHTTRQV